MLFLFKGITEKYGFDYLHKLQQQNVRWGARHRDAVHPHRGDRRRRAPAQRRTELTHDLVRVVERVHDRHRRAALR